MARIAHGELVPVGTLLSQGAAFNMASSDEFAFDFLAAPGRSFDFMFPALQTDPADRLVEGPATVAALTALGRSMHDPGDGPGQPSGDSLALPAVFTYLGQFIDHDITLEAKSGAMPSLLDPNLAPMTPDAIRDSLENERSAMLDLDSVYAPPAVRLAGNSRRMRLGKVSLLDAGEQGVRPPGKDDFNDLPRKPRSANVEIDREARIGDGRNDENLIVSQLHVAFLRAHNAIVDKGKTYKQARTLLRQHYQHIVLNEYLPTIADPAIVNGIRQNGNQFFDPAPGDIYMPLEFSVAAFRLGHSMVRSVYDFNRNFGFNGPVAPGTLELLFTFTALSGQLGFGAGKDHLVESWIIEWERFVGSANQNHARQLDTRLVEPLFHLTTFDGTELPGDAARLAVRNLLRGYLLRMPTGQAVAAAIGVPAMTTQEIEAAAIGQEQVAALQSGGFSARTPLWYYVLAEAKHHGHGDRLGPVGSTIVAETLIGLIGRSEDSILQQPGWVPTLGATPGVFTLADLLKLAGVLDPGA